MGICPSLGLVRLSRSNSCQYTLGAIMRKVTNSRAMFILKIRSMGGMQCRWAVMRQWTDRPCSSRTKLFGNPCVLRSKLIHPFLYSGANRSWTNTCTLPLYLTWLTPRFSPTLFTLSSFQTIFAVPSLPGILPHTPRQTILRDFRVK
jgi:hypothetical protein